MLANTLELIYDVIVNPNPAMRRIAATEPRQPALLTFFLWVIISTLTSLSMMSHMLIPMVLASAILSAIGFAFTGAILHLTSTLLGGNGRLQGLLCALPFAYIPSAFTVLLPVVYYLPSATAQSLAGLFVGLIQIWTFYLVIVAIRHIYSLSTWRAIFSILLPLLAVVALIFAMFFLMMAGLAGALMQHSDLLQGMQGLPQGAPF